MTFWRLMVYAFFVFVALAIVFLVLPKVFGLIYRVLRKLGYAIASSSSWPPSAQPMKQSKGPERSASIHPGDSWMLAVTKCISIARAKAHQLWSLNPDCGTIRWSGT